MVGQKNRHFRTTHLRDVCAILQAPLPLYVIREQFGGDLHMCGAQAVPLHAVSSNAYEWSSECTVGSGGNQFDRSLTLGYRLLWTPNPGAAPCPAIPDFPRAVS